MSRIARYVWLVSIAAVGAGVFLFLEDPTFSLPFAQAALTFGFIGVLAQLFSYRTGRGSMGSVSFIPVLASAAIAPPLGQRCSSRGSFPGRPNSREKRPNQNGFQRRTGDTRARARDLCISGAWWDSIAQ